MNIQPERKLHWNVARLAQEQGLKNVSKLSFKMEVARQGLYNIWRDEAAQVSLDILTKLARTLEADPGEWFIWNLIPCSNEASTATVHNFVLDWNIRARMEALGLTPVKLGFRAELFSGSIVPIVEGSAKAVSIEALAKLARALHRDDWPFNIGTLFVWDNL
jgi:transcriptional regulator with XRE-family HTH domain